eukprot:2509737-Prymnesium_polylepis.1
MRSRDWSRRNRGSNHVGIPMPHAASERADRMPHPRNMKPLRAAHVTAARDAHPHSYLCDLPARSCVSLHLPAQPTDMYMYMYPANAHGDLYGRASPPSRSPLVTMRSIRYTANPFRRKAVPGRGRGRIASCCLGIQSVDIMRCHTAGRCCSANTLVSTRAVTCG